MQTPSCLNDLKQALHLPPYWVDRPKGICKVEEGQNHVPEVTRCITIGPDFTWKVHVHGKEVNCCSTAFQHIGDQLEPASLQVLVDTVDQCMICPGNSESQFVSLVEARKGSVKKSNGDVSAYIDNSLPFSDPAGELSYKTVRSAQCALLIASGNSKCETCRVYRKNLRAMLSSSVKVSSPEKRKRLESSSHTNYRYLNTPELGKRLKNSRKATRSLSRKLEHMKLNLKTLTESNGVNLDDSLNSDMCSIVKDSHDMISAHPPDSFARLFWDQQRESMMNNPKQMRWHPMMIKWCIHLKMLSSSCYNSLKSSGVMKLPSERTLRDYTKVIKARSGLHKDVDEQLMKEVDIENASDHKKCVALLFDEVKIKEDLVYNKHTGEVIGFVNVTDINEHLSALERSCSDETHKPNLATHMLVFMVRGICSSLKYPYAQFPVKAASGDTLHPIVWRCVEHLEGIGLKVLCFVCDGASSNRKFYQMHSTDKSLTHQVKNVYSDKDSPLFLISDIPHLLKTARNSWANSHAHSCTRQLWVCLINDCYS